MTAAAVEYNVVVAQLRRFVPATLSGIPPAEKHIAIVEKLDGKSSGCMGKVTDEQYGA
ncbi:MAG TPA: hypothetical protein VMU05_03845 [Dongiaceae bacterium]|nr:hypothetical protein [Dongiaceae bacterium]